MTKSWAGCWKFRTGKVLSALAGVAGAIAGFYFRSRGSEKNPSSDKDNDSAQDSDEGSGNSANNKGQDS